MTELEFESDAFLALLTDALRAGPGSPSWHEALQRLRAGGIRDADEYRLLVTAREHLESGKGYRSIRAGAGFTQKVLTAIDEEAARGPRTPPTATAIAIASSAVMLVVLLVIGYLLWTASDKPAAPIDESTLLVNTVSEANFEAALPSDWRQVGRLPIEFTRSAMRHSASVESTATGGGIVWNPPIAPAEPFAVVTSLRVFRPDENLIAQVFVTDEPEFSDDNATTPHELVWLLQTNRAQVILPSGRLEAQQELRKDFRGSLTVRITVNKSDAVVEQGGNVIWSGPHGLDPSRPRYVGVRFLKRSADASDSIIFQNVRVNMRQK